VKPKGQKLDIIVTSVADDNPVQDWDSVSDHTLVFHRKEPPTIKSMLEASTRWLRQDSVMAIVNSDILLGKEILGIRPAASSMGGTWAATSFRRELSNDEIEKGLDRVEGQGLDIFVITPSVARHIIRDIPDFLTIGRGGWDNWMCGWMRKNLQDGRFFDFTNWRCVHHRRHKSGMDRHAPYTEEQTKQIFNGISKNGLPNLQFQYPL